VVLIADGHSSTKPCESKELISAPEVVLQALHTDVERALIWQVSGSIIEVEVRFLAADAVWYPLWIRTTKSAPPDYGLLGACQSAQVSRLIRLVGHVDRFCKYFGPAEALGQESAKI
jgi:hypothetical protein